MKNKKDYTVAVMSIYIILVIAIFGFTGYLFYFAKCETIKHYWLVVHTPGRCIK